MAYQLVKVYFMPWVLVIVYIVRLYLFRFYMYFFVYFSHSYMKSSISILYKQLPHILFQVNDKNNPKNTIISSSHFY